MNLNLYLIKKELSHDIPLQEHLIDSPLKLSCIYPTIQPGITVFTEGPIYIVKASELSGDECFEGHPSLICICKPPHNFLKKNCNILYTIQDYDPLILLNKLQKIFYHYYEWENQMQQIIDQDLPIKELGNLSFPLFGNPILLQGASFKGIFQIVPKPSKNASQLHKDYYATYKLTDNTYMSIEEINMLVTDSEYIASITADEPTIYSGEKYGFRTLFYNIRIRDVPVARLCVDEIFKVFSNYDFTLVKIFGTFLQKALQRQEPSNFNRPQGLDYVLTNLLQHHLITEERISVVVTNLQWDIHDTYFCILMTPQMENTEDVLNPLAFQLTLTLPTNCYTIFKKQILLLFNLTQAKTTREHIISLCPPLLRDNLLKAGISTEFHDFKDLYYYYLQTESALELGRKNNPSFWYYRFEDYSLRYLIEKCSTKQVSTALIPDGLKKLIHYDKQKGTDYTQLLRIHLENNMNIAETVRKTFLHRNTVLYRMNRIQEISQLDLNDYETRLYLQISYKILDFS